MTAGMFPTEIRNTALGCLTNVVICMTGGFSPLFLNWLSKYNSMAPAFYVMFWCFVSAVTVALAIALEDRGMVLRHIGDAPHRPTPADPEECTSGRSPKSIQ
mmetsp:Transcript_94360/g.158401  ORF Transcript_94360/g.158401 Transcript_94360/m.158401 type:complete len:102 (+) Transcript_94360:1-306(+)